MKALYNRPFLKQFDFVVSNPPFKMDFEDTREKIAAQPVRFWAGVPNVPAKAKDKMAIYTCFIQHVINSLKDSGKGAIVIPTGFLTAKSGIEKKILQKIVDEKIIYGVVSMPSNVFATTGTNVSVLFFDKSKKNDEVILIDASKLGEEYKEGKNQKKRLRDFEIEQIISTFRDKKSVDDFSISVTYDKIKGKNYSLSAGQYFDIKIEFVEITEEEFHQKLADFQAELDELTTQGSELDKKIAEGLKKLRFNS